MVAKAEEELVMRVNNLSLAVVKQSAKIDRAVAERPSVQTGKISVLVADSDQFVRCGLLYVLGAADFIEPAGEAQDANTALDEITRLQPNVAIVGEKFANIGIIELLSAIKNRALNTKILVLGNDNSGQMLHSLMQAGVLGYCLRSCPPKSLLNALQAVSQGAIWIDPLLAHVFIRGPIQTYTPRSKESEATLSMREIEVLRLVAEGLGNLEIAEKLFISAETVKTHIKHIMEKLAANDRTEAAVKAIRNGLV
jgi:DNA-binding NarL/FixJ family response regulator